MTLTTEYRTCLLYTSVRLVGEMQIIEEGLKTRRETEREELKSEQND